jgi:hypothetical protein
MIPGFFKERCLAKNMEMSREPVMPSLNGCACAGAIVTEGPENAEKEVFEPWVA